MAAVKQQLSEICDPQMAADLKKSQTLFFKARLENVISTLKEENFFESLSQEVLTEENIGRVAKMCHIFLDMKTQLTNRENLGSCIQTVLSLLTNVGYRKFFAPLLVNLVPGAEDAVDELLTDLNNEFTKNQKMYKLKAIIDTMDMYDHSKKKISSTTFSIVTSAYGTALPKWILSLVRRVCENHIKEKCSALLKTIEFSSEDEEEEDAPARKKSKHDHRRQVSVDNIEEKRDVRSLPSFDGEGPHARLSTRRNSDEVPLAQTSESAVATVSRPRQNSYADLARLGQKPGS